MDAEVLELGLVVAGELLSQGAHGVVMTGSHVRGDASPDSDVDIYALGEGPRYQLEQRGGYLVSTSWRTVLEVRHSFRSPEEAGAAVPVWRAAAILVDGDGSAAILKEEAAAWTWDTAGRERCDAYVAGLITELAEEVHKLVVALESGNRWPAAVQRSILALRLAHLLAVHHRLLYESENYLWSAVADVMDEPWPRLQATALSDGGQPFVDTCHAALSMYEIAARDTWQVLGEGQRRVVRRACDLAEQARRTAD